MKQYRIIQTNYYDEFGKLSSTNYHIEYEKKTWFGTFWRSIKHERCDMSGSYKSTTIFDTAEAARTFIEEILLKNAPVDKLTETVLEVITS